ncbi:MAG: ComEC/Rec2 family competence protein [Hyphomicrobiales bacterium]
MALKNLDQKKRAGTDTRPFAVDDFTKPQQWLETIKLLGFICKHHLNDEVERAEPFIWFTVTFLIGVIVYFSAPQEPSLLAATTVTLLATLATVLLRHKGRQFYYALAVSSLLAGFTAATFHTHLKTQPPITRTTNQTIKAHVTSIERRADGSRRIILEHVQSVKQDQDVSLPNKIRLRLLSKAAIVETGDYIQANVRLSPPIGPVIPGGFDFSRDLFFKGIGASGFIYGAPEVLKGGGTKNRLGSRIERLRNLIEGRVTDALKSNGLGSVAGFATAVLVGTKGAIKQEDRRVLAISGLAYLLAISGLHMALVFTFVMFAARAGMARWSVIPSDVPIRDIAIGLGLVTTLIYYTISGGSISATRAFIMVSIMALALLSGRRALSVRNIAVAAFLILALSPAAAIGPGFQMSFMATLFLVSFSSWWLLPKVDHNDTKLSKPKRWFHSLKRYGIGLIITSSLAGLATAPIAAFHFNQFAPFGLAANLLAVPIFSVLVMPFGFLGLIAMPFGFEAFPLFVMGQGIGLIQSVAEWFETLSIGLSTTPQVSSSIITMVFLIMMIAALLKSKLRYIILGFGLGVLYFIPITPKPNVLISEDGKTVAIVHKGTLVVSGARAGKFETKVWRQALGFPLHQSKDKTNGTTPAQSFQCDQFGCLYQAANYTIAHVKHPSAFYEDCRKAAVVVSELSAPQFCSNTALVIDRNALKQGGSHKLYLETKEKEGKTLLNFSIQKAIPDIKRPWHAQYKPSN